MSVNCNISEPVQTPLDGIYPNDDRTFFMHDEAGKLVPMDVAGLGAMSFASDTRSAAENHTPQTSPPQFLFRSVRACDLLLVDQHSLFPTEPPLFLKLGQHGHVQHIGRPAPEGLSCFDNGGCEQCHKRYEIMFELAEEACRDLAHMLPQWLTTLREFRNLYHQMSPAKAQSHELHRPLTDWAPFTEEELNKISPPWRKLYRSSRHGLLDTYIEKAEYLLVNLPERISSIANRYPSFPVDGPNSLLRPTDWLQDQAKELIGWRKFLLGGYFGLVDVKAKLAYEKSERMDDVA